MDAIIRDGVKPTAACTDFPALFQTYLLNGAAQALQQVRTQPMLVKQVSSREEVLHLLTFALESPPAYRIASEIVQQLTPAMEQAGLWERWTAYLHKALLQSQQQQDPVAEAYCHFWLGQLYQNQSDLAAAHRHWTAALHLFAATGDTPNQAKTLNRLAYLARLERRYTDVETFVAAACRLLAADDPEQVFSHFVQGVLALDRAQYATAATCFQAAFVLSEQQHDKVLMARHLRNVGVCLRALTRYDEAIACYERAGALFGEIYDPVQQAVTAMNRGVIYLLMTQPQPALHCFAEAEPIFREVLDHRHLAMLYLNQGIAYRLQQAWPLAEQHCQASIDLFQQIGDREGEVNALEELGLTYVGQGVVDEAKRLFNQGLQHLSEMERDPAYPTLYQNLCHHLQKIQTAEQARSNEDG